MPFRMRAFSCCCCCFFLSLSHLSISFSIVIKLKWMWRSRTRKRNFASIPLFVPFQCVCLSTVSSHYSCVSYVHNRIRSPFFFNSIMELKNVKPRAAAPKRNIWSYFIEWYTHTHNSHSIEIDRDWNRWQILEASREFFFVRSFVRFVNWTLRMEFSDLRAWRRSRLIAWKNVYIWKISIHTSNLSDRHN